MFKPIFELNLSKIYRLYILVWRAKMLEARAKIMAKANEKKFPYNNEKKISKVLNCPKVAKNIQNLISLSL